MRSFLERTSMQHHPLRVLEAFLEREQAHELAKKYDAMRFVGYVLDIGYDTVTIITSDPFKIAVGGIPRNSLLIMVPASLEGLPLHFTLLRVLEPAPTPLKQEVQQTYFELQKKSMPELDVFTQSELRWGALKTGVLGMFYAHPEQPNAVEFSGDLNNFVSAHKYRLFDMNGEYANDNPQDGSRSLRSGYPDRCKIYAFVERRNTPSRPLKLNFYEHPESALPILGSLLKGDNKTSTYIQAFTSVELPSLQELAALPPNGGELARPLRRVQILWAILKKAGFQANETKLLELAPSGRPAYKFNPGFSGELRTAAYQASDRRLTTPPDVPNNLETLLRELEVVNKFRRNHPESELLKSHGSGHPLFEADEKALLDFLDPPPGRSGPSLLQNYRKYHAPNAGDFVKEILFLLDAGETVILDLGNANPEVLTYFSDELSQSVFNHQMDKFTNNQLGNHFVQLYFEEAHNLFPRNTDENTIYTRFAKEGAKYQIGMVYSTQSPTTISRDLLAQTENFFVAHLSSQDDVDVLARVNVAYCVFTRPFV